MFGNSRLKGIFLLGVVYLFSVSSCSGTAAPMKEILISPDTVSVINNPMTGWVMYLGRNWDETFWEKQGYDNMQTSDGTVVRVSDYASTAYIRTSWSSMEPRDGEFFWKDPDNRMSRLLKSCTDRGLRLAFRIVVDGRDQGPNTPEFVYRAGAEYYLQDERFPERKTPFPQDPVFRKYYERFIKAFAAEFNDPEKTAFIDGYGLGKWGEGHNVAYEPGNAVTARTAALKEDTMKWITELYSSAFTKVPIAINYHRHIGHPVSEGRNAEPESEDLLEMAIDNGYCLRSDAIGMNNQDWGYNNWDRNFVRKWTYKVPVIIEGGWIVGQHSWKDDPAGYNSPFDVRKGEWDTAMEEKANMMDLRAGQETLSWFNDAFDLVTGFIREGGYRLYPDRILLPTEVSAGEKVTVTHRWNNLGCGYCPNNLKQWNHKYKVAFALINSEGKIVETHVDRNSEPADWIKGTPVSYDFKFRIGQLPSGSYKWIVGIADTSKDNVAGISLAIEGLEVSDGWVVLSDLIIK